MSELSLTRFKRCSKCGCIKPLSSLFFTNHPNMRDGFLSRCKTCKRIYDRARKNTDPEYDVRRYKTLASVPGYSEANRERARKWARDNAARNRARALQWQKDNPDKARARNRRRKARILNADHVPYTEADIHALWEQQGGTCAYCPAPLFGRYHVEHMTPLVRGGADAIENIALSCPPCNLSKGIKTAEEFVNPKSPL